MKSKAILFVNKPKGEPKDSDFKLDEVDVPSLEEGQVLVKNLYLSVDPYMMGKMKGSSTYTSSFELNKPLYGDGLGEVVESKCKDFSKGDIVTSSVMPWIEQCVVDGKKLKKSPEGIDNETLMSICGMPGITAYFGIEKIGEPKKGEIAVVSGAAGAVGHVACQIFKLKGCTVVGIAGGDEKIKFLKELGVDHTIDYKKEDVNQKLKELCPKGINIYWDNVGGTTLDAAVYNMADHARSIQCGSISAYTTEKPPTGPRWEFLLTMRRIRMQGMIVYDWYNEWDRAIKEIAGWYNEGKIKKRVTVKEGIKEMPGAFIGLFHGDNVGKLLVKIA